MAGKSISLTEIKKILKSEDLIIGTEKTLKKLKSGKVQKVMVSSNCPPEVEGDINYYAGLCGAQVYKLEYPNEEIGTMCKKPFSISVLSLLKGAKK